MGRFAAFRLHRGREESALTPIAKWTVAGRLPFKGGAVLRWAIGFFIVALVAALLGFGGIAFAAVGIAKFIFYIFVILFVVSLLAHLLRGSRL